MTGPSLLDAPVGPGEHFHGLRHVTLAVREDNGIRHSMAQAGDLRGRASAAHGVAAVGHDGRHQPEQVAVRVEQVAATADALHVLQG